MLARSLVWMCLLLVPLAALAQAPAGGITPIEPIKPITANPRRPAARVTQGPVKLPDDKGQVWREYDLTPYTSRVTNTARPEQAVVDWVLRETGYEAWHSEPLGILSANKNTLRVYHTPEMQAVVSEVVDRFVTGGNEAQSFGMRVVTVGNPNWRVKAESMLRSVPVQTPGVQAWVMPREDAALLMGDLRKRSDFREVSAPTMSVLNGQPAVVAQTRPRQYTRDLIMTPQAFPPFQAELATFNEGLTLELNPLLSADGRSIDAVVKCHIDQLEKLVPVSVDIPAAAGPRQRGKIDVPQVSQCRLQERFRWPTDRVLLVSVGIVPIPQLDDNGKLLGGLFSGSGDRAELLIVVENKGAVTVPSAASADGFRPGPF